MTDQTIVIASFSFIQMTYVLEHLIYATDCPQNVTALSRGMSVTYSVSALSQPSTRGGAGVCRRRILAWPGETGVIEKLLPMRPVGARQMKSEKGIWGELEA